MAGAKLTPVLVYLLNGLANLAAVDENLSDFVGKHGACETVVSALQRWPTDLQLQACGVKAVRALALCGGRNVDVLAAVRAPTAVARAQNLFLRDREVQLACLGAAEALCRGRKDRSVATTLVDAGCLSLLETAVDQFAGDAEFTAQGLRSLVEIALCGTAAAKPRPEPPAVEAGPTARWCDDQGDSNLSQPPSLPFLRAESNGEQSGTGENLLPAPVTKRRSGETSTTPAAAAEAAEAAAVDAFRAVGIVLAILERNPCREVCLSAFDALGRLLAVLETTTGSTGVRAQTRDDWYGIGAGSAACSGGTTAGKMESDGTAGTRGLLQWSRVGYAVKRALKVNRRDDTDLAASARKVLTLVAAVRGSRALAQ